MKDAPIIFLPGKKHAEPKAKPKSLGKVTGYNNYGKGLTLNCSNAKVNLSILSPDLIRIRLDPGGRFLENHSWAVIKKEEGWGKVDYNLKEEEDRIEIKTSELKISINKSPCVISFYDENNGLISRDYQPMQWRRSKEGFEVKCTKHMPYDEHYYGFGEKTGKMDKRRSSMTMWNTDAWNYDKDTDPLYVSIPFFMGLREGKGYGIFFDNSYRTTFDVGSTWEDRYTFESDGGELDYYFVYGPEIKKILERYTELTGRAPMPPRWALGHQISRYSYYPDERLLEIAEKMRFEKIPCDAFYLDIDCHKNNLTFTWDKKIFPNPKKTLAQLKEMGFKVIAIADPALKVDNSYRVYKEAKEKGFLIKLKSGKIYEDYMWPGMCSWPDFTREEVRDWWGSLHKELVEAGVAGVWNDMNEPSVFNYLRDPIKTMDNDTVFFDNGLNTTHRKNHNVYALTEVMATYNSLIPLMQGKRPFVLSRAGYAGIQRYAATWTGDNTGNWEHLSLQIPMFLNMGLSGISFVGSDIGGFMGSTPPELLVRWYEASALVPFCRNHACKGTYDQEPWVYGEHYTSIIRKCMNLRYELLPYLYDLVYESSTRGYPILRPLFFEFQSDENTYTIEDEFMVGPHLLIAPILKEGAEKRLIYLPEGRWFDYWSKQPIKGKQWLNYEAPLDKLPIFIREGSIIPKQKVLQYTDQEEIKEIILEVYPSEHTVRYRLYEDDGVSLNSPCSITEFSYERKEKVVFKIEKIEKMNKGAHIGAETLLLKFYDAKPSMVRVDGKLKKVQIEDDCLTIKVPASAKTVILKNKK